MNDAKPTPSKQEPRKVDKSPRTPLMKSTVVSQISSAIGKHTSGLSSDVLSKFGSRNRNRPKEDLVSQLEEVCSLICNNFLNDVVFYFCTTNINVMFIYLSNRDGKTSELIGKLL